VNGLVTSQNPIVSTWRSDWIKSKLVYVSNSLSNVSAWAGETGYGVNVFLVKLIFSALCFVSHCSRLSFSVVFCVIVFPMIPP
jgi:hypothetical protein